MKQHITVEQLNELNHKEKEKLLGWLVSKNYAVLDNDNTWTFISLSIGQMIEFLDEYRKSHIMIDHIFYQPLTGHHGVWEISSMNDAYLNDRAYPELCDALWEAVKEILNK